MAAKAPVSNLSQAASKCNFVAQDQIWCVDATFSYLLLYSYFNPAPNDKSTYLSLLKSVVDDNFIVTLAPNLCFIDKKMLREKEKTLFYAFPQCFIRDFFSSV